MFTEFCRNCGKFRIFAGGHRCFHKKFLIISWIQWNRGNLTARSQGFSRNSVDQNGKELGFLSSIRFYQVASAWQPWQQVFLGLGLAWMIGAFYWQNEHSGGANPKWFLAYPLARLSGTGCTPYCEKSSDLKNCLLPTQIYYTLRIEKVSVF